MDIKMPKLGESVHEGTIEQWLISVGDYVDEYEPLCEVITDKVTLIQLYLVLSLKF